MPPITVLTLLKKYDAWVKNDEIQFLESGSKEQKDVSNDLKDLIALFQEAVDKKEKGEGDISENLDWHKAHLKGRELWQKLASCSLNHIDEGAKGNSNLFAFLEAATDFEDLLYGLERYYRDHTLHSLWVYFLGEYILRDLLPNVREAPNWYLINDIELEQAKYGYDDELLEKAKSKKSDLCEQINKSIDAIWCIMALCHDLGYSLAKLQKLNAKVKAVLDFLDFPAFTRIGYSFDVEHQSLISQFLELMAMDVRIVPSENYRDKSVNLDEKVLIKCYRDDSSYWQLCRSLEQKHHGILSSYLIYKLLSLFAETWVRGPGEKWGLTDSEAKDNVIRGNILFAIAQHTFDFAYLYQLSSLADILLLADELEEFSRYGRQTLSRKYHDTTAEAQIYFRPRRPKRGKDLDMFINYTADKHLTLDLFYEFFRRKAQRLCRMYSLEQGVDKKDEAEEFSTIRSIKMTVKKGRKKLFFYLSMDPKKTTGYLPRTKTHQEGERKLVCQDDKICYVTESGKEISLEDWFKNVQ